MRWRLVWLAPVPQLTVTERKNFKKVYNNVYNHLNESCSGHCLPVVVFIALHKVVLTFESVDEILAPVVQRVDSVIHRISCYPEDMKYVGKTRYSHMSLMQNEDKSTKIIGLCKNLAKVASNGICWLHSGWSLIQ